MRITIELMETDAAYIDAMQFVNKTYIKPILSDTNMAKAFGLINEKKEPVYMSSTKTSNARIISVFGNLGELIEEHKATQAHIRKHTHFNAEEKDFYGLSKSVAESISDHFGCYSVYFANYQKAIDQLHALKKDNSVNNLLETLKGRGKDDRNLESFLIMPIQRLPRYKLLFTVSVLFIHSLQQTQDSDFDQSQS